MKTYVRWGFTSALFVSSMTLASAHPGHFGHGTDVTWPLAVIVAGIAFAYARLSAARSRQ